MAAARIGMKPLFGACPGANPGFRKSTLKEVMHSRLISTTASDALMVRDKRHLLTPLRSRAC